MSDNESDQQEYHDRFIASRDVLLFVIDASSPMFVNDTDQKSPFCLALEAAHGLMAKKIIESERDMIGVLLYGTAEKKAPEDMTSFDNLYSLIDLQPPEIESIKLLEELCSGDMEIEPTDPPCYSLAEVLWQCSDIFNKKCKKMDQKRVFLFTHEDNPHQSSQELKKQARLRANDLHDSGVEISLFPLGQTFNIHYFYQPLMEEIYGEYAEKPCLTRTIEHLLISVRRRATKRRAMARLKFSVGPGILLAVGLYKLVGEALPPKKVFLDKRSNEPLLVMNKKYNAETAEILLKTEINKVQYYGGEHIALTDEERKSLSQLAQPGLELLGFKPLDRIKSHYHVRSSTFIYPDEDAIKGSRALFKALLVRCLARDVCMLCRLVPGRNKPPYIVALLPQEELRNQQGELDLPSGFHVVYMPYAEDFRTLTYSEMLSGTNLTEEDGTPVKDVWRASQEQIEVAKAVVKKLCPSKLYHPSDFENPVLQTLYRSIEALALEREQPETVEDTTKPQYEKMQKRLGPLSDEFLEAVYPENYNPEVKPPVPRVKQEKVKKEATATDVESAARAGNLNKLTVDVLKNFCKENGITITKKKKAELIQDINAHFGL